MGLRADGPPGRWKKNIRNKKKQEAEEGRKPMKKLQSSAGQEAWQEAGQAAGQEAGQCGSLHLFSIGNYFHRALSSESNINPKIII